MGRVKRHTFRAAAGALAAAALAASGTAPLTGAGEIAISMDAGRVTLIATDARLADVLAEWSRVGQTQFVGAEPIGGELITLHLVDAAEAEAIHFLLGSAAGYVAAPRRGGVSGVSRYDRVTIMATPGTPVSPVRPPAPLGGGGVSAEAQPAYDPVRASPEAPALVRMEDLQRLLDAATAEAESPPPDTEPAAAPVVTTPFPGIGADPGESPLPERWRRQPRRR